MKTKIIAAISAVFALTLAGFLTASPADAHTPKAGLTCTSWSVSLTSYDKTATAIVNVDGVNIQNGLFNGSYVKSGTFTNTYFTDTHRLQVTVKSKDQVDPKTGKSPYDFAYDQSVKGCATPVPPNPGDRVETKHAESGDCNTGVYTVTDSKRSIPQVFDKATGKYVDGTPGPWVDTVTTRPLTDAEFAACAGPQPPNKVTTTYTDWTLGTSKCGDTTRTDTHQKTVTTITYTRVGSKWVENKPTSVTTTETRIVDIPVEACPVVTPPATPTPTPVVTPPAQRQVAQAPRLAETGTNGGFLLQLLIWGSIILVAGVLLAVFGPRLWAKIIRRS